MPHCVRRDPALPQKRDTAPLWRRGSWVPIEQNAARAEAYLRAKFHLDLTNRLGTVVERHRQDRQTGQTDS